MRRPEVEPPPSPPSLALVIAGRAHSAAPAAPLGRTLLAHIRDQCVRLVDATDRSPSPCRHRAPSPYVGLEQCRSPRFVFELFERGENLGRRRRCSLSAAQGAHGSDTRAGFLAPGHGQWHAVGKSSRSKGRYFELIYGERGAWTTDGPADRSRYRSVAMLRRSARTATTANPAVTTSRRSSNVPSRASRVELLLGWTLRPRCEHCRRRTGAWSGVTSRTSHHLHGRRLSASAFAMARPRSTS